MKKTAIASALALSMGMGIAQGAVMTSATFSMFSPGGLVGAFPDVTGSIGGGAWSVASTSTFFGFNWTAHNGTTFGPGSYTIDTIQGGIYSFTVGAGQVGGHILFDWNTAADIDVVNVWDVCTGCGSYTSTDWDGDGTLGGKMIDGAFPGFSANFDFVAPIPVPAAVWLFGSGLIGLVGVARRKRAA